MTADTLREKLEKLVGELHEQAALYRRGQELWDERQALVYTQVARKLAAILAESEEPKPAPPIPPVGQTWCVRCNQPHPCGCRQVNPGQTHYVGDDCPGGHAEECVEWKPCRRKHEEDHPGIFCEVLCDDCGRPKEAHEAKLKLLLGHGFVAASGSPETCQYPFCGQPRSAHEPKEAKPGEPKLPLGHEWEGSPGYNPCCMFRIVEKLGTRPCNKSKAEHEPKP